MEQQEIINAIALTRIGYFNLAGWGALCRKLGSATAVMDHRHHIRDILPDASPRLVHALDNVGDAIHRAEAELEWDLAHGVEPLCMGDDRYPQRLKDCPDAPLVLFYRGSADLNSSRVISVVGTRRATAYAKDLIDRFMSDLRQLCPHVLVVSGLAYGVDILAHRAALNNGYETAGVLAHGLDDLYPTAHRQTAEEMERHGGLLTEFLTGTNADKMNFVRRNRIVAGVADACILVESAARGGGLITCSIARSYAREVFAFPGPVGAPYSEGCNHLIRDNAAALITGAADFVQAMGWEEDRKIADSRRAGIERQLFPDLSDDEKRIVSALERHNDLQINMLSAQADIPIARLTALLFSLEMKGVVRTLAGGMYHLIG